MNTRYGCNPYGLNRWVAALSAVLLLSLTQTAQAQTAKAPQAAQASLKYPNISHVLKQAFSVGVQANHVKDPSALEFTPIGFGCMQQIFFRPEVLNQIIERSPRADVAWLERQLALPQNAAQIEVFDRTMTQAMQQSDEQKMDELAIQGFTQLELVLSERGHPVVVNSLNALGDAPDRPEFEAYWLEAMETPQCKAYAERIPE